MNLNQLDTKQVGALVVAALLFVAGWQLGRVTSPYYAAHPIVFSDTSDPNDPNALIELRDEGVAARVADSSPAPTVQVAASKTESSTSGGQVQGQFVGSVNSDKYHSTQCSTWRRIKVENQIWFADQVAAEAAGYIPTKCTADLLGGGGG